jgi:hypothetical protein
VDEGAVNTSFTPSAPQREQRSIKELMQAQFMSLSADEKARVLLPLLPTLDPIANDLKRTDNDTSRMQRTPNHRQTRAKSSDRVAALPKTVPSQYDGDSLVDSLTQDIKGEHSEPDWYQNLLREDDEATQAFSACSGAWSGCSGCSQCYKSQVRQGTTKSAPTEDAALNLRSHNTANDWLAACPCRIAHEQSGTLSSVLQEQNLGEKQPFQSSKQKLEDVVRQQASTCHGCWHGCDSCCPIEQASGNKDDNDRGPDSDEVCAWCGSSETLTFDDRTIECAGCGASEKPSLKSPERANDSPSWKGPVARDHETHKTAPVWDASAFGAFARGSAAGNWGTSIDQDVETTEDRSGSRSANDFPGDAWGENLADSKVKPRGFFKQTREPLFAVENITEAPQVVTDHQWTTERDEILLSLKRGPTKKTKKAWSKAATQIGVTVEMCKERLDFLKDDKKAKAKKNSIKTGYTKADDGSTTGNEDNNRTGIVENCWDTGGFSWGNIQPWGDLPDPAAVCVPEHFSGPSERFSSVREVPATTGWKCSDNTSGGFDALFTNGGNNPTSPAPSKPASKTYTVTYWATVESGDKTVHIPIDSNNISGPKKIILDGPAKKVWKWIQDRGLGDQVGLQDAFDLAKQIQDDDKDTVGVPEEDEPDIHRSRAASNCWEAPVPSRVASPTRSDYVEDLCRGCDWECVCRKDDGGGWGYPADRWDA